ncbi:DEAD/DEAH box helicase [Devosia sp. D6-9]|nr:DEAD/DEAH box helicase [Devosia sp. D6-9]
MTLPSSIAPALAGALTARGYETLTPVQLAVLAPETEGADLLVSAQTGSGKTVAFGMAIAPTLLEGGDHLGQAGKPMALVIAPTRELALQVQRELAWLYADAGARIVSNVGGMDIRTERRALAHGAHIVVGTPGRLRDHITKGALDISELRAVVLDEADEMLDLGFREDLEFILAAAPEERRTLMFSATVPKAIAQLAATYQRDALRLSVAGAASQHVDIDYKLLTVPAPDRENAIINTLLYYDAPNAIIFCHTRESVKHLAARLLNRGFAVVALSGELTQAERTNALQSMRDGRARVCVATDVAARGIDIPNLDLVIHADIPGNPDTLLHRSGRTGRAGRKGTCVLVVPQHRRGAVQRVLKLARVEASYMPAPTSAQIEARYRQAILDDTSLTEPLDEDLNGFATELLARYTPEQVAAAYLRIQLAARPVPEEIEDLPPPSAPGKRAERTERPERAGKPGERVSGGTWFSLSLGRKQKADPRWLLPMICKAGGVQKSAVGSIRILDRETHFEIAADMADDFIGHLEAHGTGERNVEITVLDGAPQAPAPRKMGRGDKPWKDRANKARGASFDPMTDAAPSVDELPPPADAKRKPKAKAKPFNKDKGKPDFKAKKARAAAAANRDVGEQTFKPRRKKGAEE